MDREIVEAARAGDPAAFNALVEDFTPTVFGVAYGWCGDRHLAADIAQEVFTTAYVKLDTLNDPAAIAGWLLAITRSVAGRTLRGRPMVATSEPPVAHVEDDVIAADEARSVRQAVEALPTDLRVPIVLHYFAGRPLADIAALCEVPLSTVKKRMRDARARIRRSGLGSGRRVAEALLGDGDRALVESDAIRVFSALRTGDTGLLASLLDARPDLVEVREDWSREEGWRHGLLPTHGGTPLLRAVERGDLAMVRLLLDRGADPDGACTCDGAESPMWVASVQGDAAAVEMLLARGADPDRPAFAGLMPLDVAAMRGHEGIVQRLRAAGAHGSATARTMLPPVTPGRGTGIKAIDLWCPLPESGLVHLNFAYGTGALVLLCELTRRWIDGGRQVVWIGFVPQPLDLGDIHHSVAEAGLTGEFAIALTDHTAAHDRRRSTLAGCLSEVDEHATLVVFNDVGFRDAVDEHLFDLARRNGLTVVVSPIDDLDRPRFGSAPFVASIRFDRERAERGRWPAVGAESWSVVASPEMAALATRARRGMTDELDRYLCQPFHIAEHVTGRPGEWVSEIDLAAEVAGRLGLETLEDHPTQPPA